MNKDDMSYLLADYYKGAQSGLWTPQIEGKCTNGILITNLMILPQRFDKNP